MLVWYPIIIPLFLQVCAVAERAQCATTEETHANKIKQNKASSSVWQNMLQILTMQPNREKQCKYLQRKPIQKHTTNTQCNPYRNALQIQKHAANAHNATQYRNALQILAMQPNTETRCKCSHATKYKNMLQKLITQLNIETRSNNATKYRDTLYVQRNEIQKHTANTYNNQIQKCAANTHNATKYRNTLQILRTQPNTEIIFITFILPGKEAHWD